MAFILLGAAKGAPGVTVTTTALAAVWPSPVILVEADPSGSDLHLLLRTDGGRPLQGGQRGAGMLGLAAHGGSRATLLDEPICQQTDLGVPVVIGPPHSRAAYAMGLAWGQAAHSLAQLSREGHYDVLVDIGRVDDQSLALPLIRRADIVVLLAKRNLRGIAHTRRVAGIVEEHLRGDTASAAAAAAHLLIVDDPATATRVQTQWALAAKGLTRPWTTLGMLPHDGEGAHDFFNAKSSRRDVSDFTNSVREVATELHDLARHLPTPVVGPADGSASAPDPAPDLAPGPAFTEVKTATETAAGTFVPAAAATAPASAPASASDLTQAASDTPPSRSAVVASAAAVSTAPDAAVVWPPRPPSRRGTAEGSGGVNLDAQDCLRDNEDAERGSSDDGTQIPSLPPARATSGSGSVSSTPSSSMPSSSSAASPEASSFTAGLDNQDQDEDQDATTRDAPRAPVRRRQRLTGAGTRTR